MKIIKRIRSIIFNLHFILFITGFFIAAFLFCSLQADYENRLFVSLAQKIKTGKEKPGEEVFLKKALHTTYNLLEERSQLFTNTQTGGFLDDFIHPVSADLMTAEGACGSYSAVLCRLVNTLGFATRFAQMKVDGKYGGHIVIEAKISTGWVVLDPRFNVYFTKPDGALASFNDISANWPLYKKQVPPGYNMHYNYQGVRYTNWNKIPFVMPAIRNTLSLFMSENELQQISLRNYFLNKYAVCSNVLLLFIFPLSFIIIIKKTGYQFSVKFKLHSLRRELSNFHPGHAGALTRIFF